jgi:enoyl-CoA hydratase
LKENREAFMDAGMTAFDTVTYAKKGHIAYITLNRPMALNAFSIQMRDDLYEVMSAVLIDDEVRVALVQGAGEKAFCAGADLTEFLTAPSQNEARLIRHRRDLWRLILSIPQPLIAAIQGYCLGSGMEIAMCCDLRMASEDAEFGLPEVGLGILPGAGGTQTVTRTIGVSRALDMLLTNRWLKSDEAYRFGLVNRVVPRDDLLRTAEETADRISTFDPVVVRKIKEAVRRGIDLPLLEGLELERRLAAQVKQRDRS